MTTQTLTIGRRRFVLLPERDFKKLQKQADRATVRSDFAEEAMRDVKAYRKHGKAANWTDVKRKLGL